MGIETSHENLLGYEITVSEMKYRLEEVYKGIDEIKMTFRNVFGAASLIVALMGALQIFSADVVPEDKDLYYLLISFSIALYVLLIAGCIWMISPVKVAGPTPAKWDKLKAGFIDREDKSKIYEQLIKNYINAINESEGKVTQRYKWGKLFLYLLPIIVVLLFWISLLPRVSAP